MPDASAALVLDLIEWVGGSTRPYAEVMEVWRSTCPRLTIFEDAMALGLVECRREQDGALLVVATAEGLAHLQAARPGWAMHQAAPTR